MNIVVIDELETKRTYGSLQNSLARQSRDLVDIPRVGTPCTILMWTDRYAAVITSVSEYVKDGKPSWVGIKRHEVRAKHQGFTESQDWELLGPRKDREEERFTLRKHGKYVRQGERMQDTALLIGVAKHYIDPGF